MTDRSRPAARPPEGALARWVLVGLGWLGAGIAAGELLARFAGSGLVRATGETVRTLLAATGARAELAGEVLSGPGGFAYRITPACLGLGPAAVVALLLALRPAPTGRRVALAAGGAAAMLGANLLRLVGLFRLGSVFPERFDLLHLGLGQAWMLLAMAVILLPGISRTPAVASAEAGP